MEEWLATISRLLGEGVLARIQHSGASSGAIPLSTADETEAKKRARQIEELYKKSPDPRGHLVLGLASSPPAQRAGDPRKGKLRLDSLDDTPQYRVAFLALRR